MNFLELIGNVLLFALVFGMSATVDINCMKEQVRNKTALLLGAFCQFVLLPFLGYLVVRAMELNHATGITLLVVTSSPGGSYSNWWCSMFNADLALSVTMTAISTILSIVALPLNLLLYANIVYDEDVTQDLDWRSLFISLFIVISAISLGLYCSYRSHSFKFNVMANQVGNWAGLGLILFSALVTNSGSAETKIWSRGWVFYVAVGLPCVLSLLLVSGLASFLQLQPPERMSVAVECCYQNVGIATSLAMTMFDGDALKEAMGVPFFYGTCEALFVGIYCIIAWKLGWSKAPADAPFWKIIVTSYEVLDAEFNHELLTEIEIAISTSESNDSKSQKSETESQTGHVLTTYFELGRITEPPVQPTTPKEPSGMEDPRAIHPSTFQNNNININKQDNVDAETALS